MIYLNSLIISLVSNIFFYTDDTMHKIFINNGEYSIIYQIPSIIFSNILSSLFSIFFEKLISFHDELKTLKNEQDNSKKKEFI